ncbi:MAG TPA: Crp/Fnr family transcriptional regulator [Thermopetrobacter sp.]|nr:Crp/Fnr family transcriptional regulator [Thermopetrobacter sp.]
MNLHASGGTLLPEFLRICEACPARHGGVCDNISVEELALLNRMAHHRRFARGQVIFAEDEPPTFVANIISGSVKLTRSLADGRQQIVGLLFPPDFLGRAVGRGVPCLAEAATEVELCCYPAEAFRALIAEHPAIERRLLEKALDELDAAREWMVLLGRKTAREKVASFFLLLARRITRAACPTCRPASAEVHVRLPLKRADIADFLGLTIETVSRQITALRHCGVIVSERDGVFRVPDLAALRAAAGQDDEEASAAPA